MGIKTHKCTKKIFNNEYIEWLNKCPAMTPMVAQKIIINSINQPMGNAIYEPLYENNRSVLGRNRVELA